MIRAALIVVVIVAGLVLLVLIPFIDLPQEPRPGPEGPSIYTAAGHAFLSPLLALPRFSDPTSSVVLSFAPLRHCEGATVVRP
jgi:hypothetical protein